MTATQFDVEKLKDILMLKRGVRLSHAEKVINNRKISIQEVSKSQKRSKRKPTNT